MVAHVLAEVRNLTGDHEATHRLATAGKPVSPHRDRESKSDFTEKVLEQGRRGTI